MRKWKCKVQQNVERLQQQQRKELRRRGQICFSCFVIKFKISYFRFLTIHIACIRMYTIGIREEPLTRADSLATRNTIKNSLLDFVRSSFAFSKCRRMMTYSAGDSLHPIIVHQSERLAHLLHYFLVNVGDWFRDGERRWVNRNVICMFGMRY